MPHRVATAAYTPCLPQLLSKVLPLLSEEPPLKVALSENPPIGHDIAGVCPSGHGKDWEVQIEVFVTNNSEQSLNRVVAGYTAKCRATHFRKKDLSTGSYDETSHVLRRPIAKTTHLYRFQSSFLTLPELSQIFVFLSSDRMNESFDRKKLMPLTYRVHEQCSTSFTPVVWLDKHRRDPNAPFVQACPIRED